ncbi:metallophosphoesterase [Robiginitalea aurantiaca]|uniref:Metallophosphoesterase n=1 Tax=Robiginitalea aurantiaca TaxID=3056915 RepID=A0ABT7WER4_9FLAO|nr:metallophosphoesterase [Robiginitalea aurantiaca]MDM9631405.1 metallophosphoesterase [Robiginitalea aurantiaca]
MKFILKATKYKKFKGIPFSLSRSFVLVVLFFSVCSCATYEPKYTDTEKAVPIEDASIPEHIFYLIGDAGYSPMDSLNPVLLRFRDRLNKAPENSTAIFLGDNIYPAGLPGPNKSKKAYKTAVSHLEAQLKTFEGFKGRPILIPGNHDWYSDGIRGLKRQERYVEKYLQTKNSFLPENGCPLETVSISDDIHLIIIDTEWYLEDWDRTPSINDDCTIKTRGLFWAELESEIKKNADKTILITAHHPIFTYGEHGGYFSGRQQFYPTGNVGPLPGLGSLLNLFRKTSGASTEDLYNPRYQEMRKRLVTLASYGERVLVASGHEHTLQYNVEQDLPQIVSGAGAKTGSTKLLGGSQFSTGMGGYAILSIYGDGSSRVSYFGVDSEGVESHLFTSGVFDKPDMERRGDFPEVQDELVKASVYRPDEVEKSRFYRGLWGERYRAYYGMEIEARTVDLDTLYGGLVPVRRGGGQQSKSLRLRHHSGREYVMRAIRKQAEQNLQAIAFQEQYIIGDFEGTAPVSFLQDMYTGSHPFAPFAIGLLSDSVQVYHTNPKLYYVPKQEALGKYNEDYGNELYMIEEHVSKKVSELEVFGDPRKILSTSELLSRLRKDEKFQIDTTWYIRSRLFDMLIGDWDRHQDQWRWGEFREPITSHIIYRPIPRDRDQVFSIMGDGSLGWLLTRTVPAVKKMEGFGPEMRNPANFNTNAFTLDRTLLGETDLRTWLEQARYIQDRISVEVIDRSFEGFPKEVRDATLEGIKSDLLDRGRRLTEYATQYYNELQEYALVQGTDKDDLFEINGLKGGGVSLKAYRIIDGQKTHKFYDKVFRPESTKEIWLYGLDDADQFEINLPRENRIKTRIIGGLGKDIYIVSSGKKARIYDHKSKKSEIRGSGSAPVLLTDDYEINSYEPLKPGTKTNQVLPVLGFNPDDGIKVGLGYTYTHFGFLRNPYTTRHSIKGAYFFATNGFELGYSGEFARILGKWNLLLDAAYTSPNFTFNFFGFGNETPNPDDTLGLDYNRVRMRILNFKPGLLWRGPLGGSMNAGVSFERVIVEETEGRFIETYYQETDAESESQFFGLGGKYQYSNQDNAAYPTLGMGVSLEAGYKREVSGREEDFGYIIPTLSLDHRITTSGNLVLATKWKAHFNLGNGYTFFQGAQIGANDGPRSYRNQRFTGKTSYYQVTDLRYQFRQMRTALFPMSLGLFAGFDYGRVWQPDDPSRRWYTSYGGGLFLVGAKRFSLNTSLFHGSEGFRFSFGFGFDF